MKKVLLSVLALLPLAISAQLPTGFYRVQNAGTSRYLSVIDNKSKGVDGTEVDIEMLRMLTGFEDTVSFNPATVCYITYIGGSSYNLSGQDMDLYANTSHYLQFTPYGTGTYRMGASSGGATKYLGDFGGKDNPCPSIKGGDQHWRFIQVDQSETSYFGVKPDIHTTDNTYWASLYAGFGFTPSAETTKVYYVSSIKNGCAIIQPLTGKVAKNSPVLVKCTGSKPSDNKLTPENYTVAVAGNLLKGYFYNSNHHENDGDGCTYNHENRKAYDEETMRVLGTTADGKPAFVKTNIDYLPANKAYLTVSSLEVDVLPIFTEEEYQEYITGIEELPAVTPAGKKVVYDLQGRRIAAPSKGLYIVNGKKIVIK
jgi:hypothetical protein